MVPWSFKVKRERHGESIALVFNGDKAAKDEMFKSRWYPPWQNDLMRSNAKTMVDDLNRAFAKRNKQPK